MPPKTRSKTKSKAKERKPTHKKRTKPKKPTPKRSPPKVSPSDAPTVPVQISPSTAPTVPRDSPKDRRYSPATKAQILRERRERKMNEPSPTDMTRSARERELLKLRGRYMDTNEAMDSESTIEMVAGIIADSNRQMHDMFMSQIGFGVDKVIIAVLSSIIRGFRTLLYNPRIIRKLERVNPGEYRATTFTKWIILLALRATNSVLEAIEYILTNPILVLVLGTMVMMFIQYMCNKLHNAEDNVLHVPYTNREAEDYMKTVGRLENDMINHKIQSIVFGGAQTAWNNSGAIFQSLTGLSGATMGAFMPSGTGGDIFFTVTKQLSGLVLKGFSWFLAARQFHLVWRTVKTRCGMRKNYQIYDDSSLGPQTLDDPNIMSEKERKRMIANPKIQKLLKTHNLPAVREAYRRNKFSARSMSAMEKRITSAHSKTTWYENWPIVRNITQFIRRETRNEGVGKYGGSRHVGLGQS